MRCFRFSRSPLAPRRGFTLLEVIVGLTLMATVLVASLLSYSAHHKQRRRADAKLAAVPIADELLGYLSGIPGGIPVNGRGPVPGSNDWYWQTSLVGTLAPAQIPIRVIRFEIIDASETGSLVPLVTIDVVKPMEAG